MSENETETEAQPTTEQKFADHMSAVSSSYRTAAGIEGAEDDGNLVDTDVVQRQNHSEHAGGERSEPVQPAEGTTPNTVNEGSETAAATRPVDEAEVVEEDDTEE